jgi:hypothetical protein
VTEQEVIAFLRRDLYNAEETRDTLTVDRERMRLCLLRLAKHRWWLDRDDHDHITRLIADALQITVEELEELSDAI